MNWSVYSVMKKKKKGRQTICIDPCWVMEVIIHTCFIVAQGPNKKKGYTCTCFSDYLPPGERVTSEISPSVACRWWRPSIFQEKSLGQISVDGKGKVRNPTSVFKHCRFWWPCQRLLFLLFSHSPPASDYRSNCASGTDRCALSQLLLMKRGKKKEKRKTCLVLHMSALFLELPGSWPHYTDLHTHSPFLSLCVCLSKLIAECRWALFHKEPADCMKWRYVCGCVRARVLAGRRDERVVTGVLTC